MCSTSWCRTIDEIKGVTSQLNEKHTYVCILYTMCRYTYTSRIQIPKLHAWKIGNIIWFFCGGVGEMMWDEWGIGVELRGLGIAMHWPYNANRLQLGRFILILLKAEFMPIYADASKIVIQRIRIMCLMLCESFLRIERCTMSDARVALQLRHIPNCSTNYGIYHSIVNAR